VARTFVRSGAPRFGAARVALCSAATAAASLAWAVGLLRATKLGR
jgi:hypothetical protein